MTYDREQKRADREVESAPPIASELPAPRTQFRSTGNIPAVDTEGPRPAQLTASERAFGSGDETHAVAASGTQGGARKLPFADQIARSFGPEHAATVQSIQAHVGGPATEANDRLGAEAYAHGNHVVFAREPDLHTAAEEAAHVVQQRAGVMLPEGVGEEGDAHEQKADAVADRVVAGEPAAQLLPQAEHTGAPAVQFKKKDLPKGDEAFQKMWEGHPHNYLPEDGSLGQNTTSPELLEELGFDPSYNTCAIRLSTMLNSIGETITPAKTKAAGIERKPSYSKATKQYYILSAAEMWTYLMKTFRQPDKTFPPKGRYKDDDEFAAAYETDIKPAIAGRHGIVAFDKIFTYSGTGHVDLFQGEQLSDAGDSFYHAQRVMLWYI